MLRHLRKTNGKTQIDFWHLNESEVQRAGQWRYQVPDQMFTLGRLGVEEKQAPCSHYLFQNPLQESKSLQISNAFKCFPHFRFPNIRSRGGVADSSSKGAEGKAMLFKMRVRSASWLAVADKMLTKRPFCKIRIGKVISRHVLGCHPKKKQYGRPPECSFQS